MSLNNVMFIDRYPKLDLHGETVETARVLIHDFIRDNIKLKHEIVVIVHGVGSGAIRQATWDVLKRHKKVLDYKTYYYNNGCTVVELQIDF